MSTHGPPPWILPKAPTKKGTPLGDQGAQVSLGEQILVVLVLRGVLPLMVQGALGARVLWGDLEVPLFLELADLWLDLKY